MPYPKAKLKRITRQITTSSFAIALREEAIEVNDIEKFVLHSVFNLAGLIRSV